MFDRHACHKQVVPPLVWPERHHRLHRYGTDNIVEDDPLDNGHDGHVLEGSDYSHIDDDSGCSRRQTYLGQLAWCGVCKTSGPILAGAGITMTVRGYDERLLAYEAVGGDIVGCKCEWPPRVVARHARCVSYVDENASSQVVVQSPTQAGSAFDEQVLASAQGVALQGYPFLIEMPDGQTVCGRVDSSGCLPRNYTENADTYTIHWGDEALSHKDWNAE